MKYYNAGHMMYLQDADRVKLHENLAAFIDRAVK
jgi:carboxypeptidase C (cathepsin A)